MPKKSDIVLMSAVAGGLLSNAGSLVAQLDTHRVGGAILAVTTVFLYAIHKWTARSRKR